MSLARARPVAVVLVESLVIGASAAYAVFNKSVTATSGFSAYTVPAPTGMGCTGLLSLVAPKIVWDAVTPPAGLTVDYLVTAPGGATTAVATNSYSLPTALPLNPGQYTVKTRISAGAWTSTGSTVTVSLNLGGLLYLCSVP